MGTGEEYDNDYLKDKSFIEILKIHLTNWKVFLEFHPVTKERNYTETEIPHNDPENQTNSKRKWSQRKWSQSAKIAAGTATFFCFLR